VCTKNPETKNKIPQPQFKEMYVDEMLAFTLKPEPRTDEQDNQNVRCSITDSVETNHVQVLQLSPQVPEGTNAISTSDVACQTRKRRKKRSSPSLKRDTRTGQEAMNNAIDLTSVAPIDIPEIVENPTEAKYLGSRDYFPFRKGLSRAMIHNFYSTSVYKEHSRIPSKKRKKRNNSSKTAEK